MKETQAHILLDPRNFWFTVTTTLLVGVAGGLGAELIKDPGQSGNWIGFTAVLAAIAFLGLLLSRRVRRALARRREFVRLGIRHHVARARALIVFVSKGQGSSSARDAALYHAAEGNLQDLWVITSSEARDDAAQITAEVKRLYPEVVVYPPMFVSDIYSIEEAKNEVEDLRRKCLRKFASEADVICDFTGLTKHMSAGMILACAPRGARLQFMHPKRFLPDGRADPAAGPSEPVEIEIAYELTGDEI